MNFQKYKLPAEFVDSYILPAVTKVGKLWSVGARQQAEVYGLCYIKYALYGDDENLREG